MHRAPSHSVLPPSIVECQCEGRAEMYIEATSWKTCLSHSLVLSLFRLQDDSRFRSRRSFFTIVPALSRAARAHSFPSGVRERACQFGHPPSRVFPTRFKRETRKSWHGWRKRVIYSVERTYAYTYRIEKSREWGVEREIEKEREKSSSASMGLCKDIRIVDSKEWARERDREERCFIADDKRIVLLLWRREAAFFATFTLSRDVIWARSRE